MNSTTNKEKQPEKIKSVESLHDHLQTAILLEHATIPAYLTALYSIKEGCNPEAALVIRSVVIEEMLHLTLASNILNAVGGSPCINGKGFVPSYPTRLPHSANRFVVNLERFSPDAVETFMRIEHPAYGLDPKPQPDEYNTIGQFYAAIRDGIEYLCGPDNQHEQEIFSGDIESQISSEQYYGGGGRIVVVHDKKTAFKAIEEIIEQGEGSGGGLNVWENPQLKLSRSRNQVAHFYLFDEIHRGRYYQEDDKPGYPTGDRLFVDWDAVWPIRADTRSSDFPKGSKIRQALDNFNRDYTRFLDLLHEAFNGKPHLIAESVPIMYDLKYKAQALACIPIPGSEETLGPSWERMPD